MSGAYDYLVKVWDPKTLACLHTLQGHTNRVYSLQVCVCVRACVCACVRDSLHVCVCVRHDGHLVVLLCSLMALTLSVAPWTHIYVCGMQKRDSVYTLCLVSCQRYCMQESSTNALSIEVARPTLIKIHVYEYEVL